MARRIAACLLPSAVIVAAWLRIEARPALGETLVVSALALAPALLPRWSLRIPALAGAAAGVLWLTFHTPLWEALPFRDERVLEPLRDSVGAGVGDYYGVVLPFDPGRHPEMHGVLLLAIFGFVALASLLVVSGRPFAAAAVTVAASGWPATLLDAGAGTIGVLVLVAVLWIFLVLRVRSVGAAVTGALASALVVGAAAWVSTATSFDQRAALEWQRWDFRGLPARALGVRFVWDASYDGISFPPTETTVLEIEGPDRAEYWRASTLDEFTADRWVEQLFPRLVSSADRAVPLDALTPSRMRERRNWVEQQVRVKALVDDRVVAAGTPVALDGPSLGTVFYLSGGVIRARHALGTGTRYRVWSYLPDPSPTALAASPAGYPRAATRFLTVWGQSLPAFRSPRRDARMRALLSDPRFPAFDAYRPLYESARRVARDAATPYAAVLALESWLRDSGSFRYDERPPSTGDVPPLVGFVTATKAGYCQHFAGAMALMLRMLGVPSRVAVGFTSGSYDRGVWKVTDHDAHAWVEVWFPKLGWVPFDPTPGRGRFAGVYSYASENAQAVEALRRGELPESAATGDRVGGRTSGTPTIDGRGSESTTPSLVGLALLLAGAWVLGVGLSKASLRRARYLTRDPRRLATASRRELEGFLRDQGIEVPPEATLQWLQTAALDLGLDGRGFARAAARARFGRPEDAEHGARAARAELKALLKRARRELPLRARMRGFLSLRSLRGGYGR